MQRNIIVLIFCLLTIPAWSEDAFPKTPIGHSHNDYHQKKPFETAIEAGMKSVEADVFLRNNTLCVGHSSHKLNAARTLSSLYLRPIAEAVRNGEAYPTELMIDVKTEANTTLQAIVEALKDYPDVFNAQSPVKIIISGKRPKPSEWENYPSFILFDGRPKEYYTNCQWQQVGMVSSSFKRYKSFLIGKCKMQKLKNMIQLVHQKGKTVRFWKTKDSEGSWKRLANLGVDVINTDKPFRLKRFLEKRKMTEVVK